MHYITYTSSVSESGSVPLDMLENGEFDLCDGLYFAADVDYQNGTEEEGTHYGKVLEVLSPLFQNKVRYVQANIDGISYTFTLTN